MQIIKCLLEIYWKFMQIIKCSCLLALPSVVKLPIQLLYPDQGFQKFEELFHVVISPRLLSGIDLEQKPLNILICNTSKNFEIFQVNHFVPLFFFCKKRKNNFVSDIPRKKIILSPMSKGKSVIDNQKIKLKHAKIYFSKIGLKKSERTQDDTLLDQKLNIPKKEKPKKILDETTPSTSKSEDGLSEASSVTLLKKNCCKLGRRNKVKTFVKFDLKVSNIF